MALNAKRIYLSTNLFPPPSHIRYAINCLSVCLFDCCQNLKGTEMPKNFIIELACENPKPKYNIQKFKHKSKKLKVKTQKAKDNKVKNPF